MREMRGANRAWGLISVSLSWKTTATKAMRLKLARQIASFSHLECDKQFYDER
jgi:hypothetical protein